jgi:hypothetical protein
MHIICTARNSSSAVLTLAEGVLITNAVHAVPERLAFLVIEESWRYKFREWHSQLRLRNVGELFSHRSHLRRGIEPRLCRNAAFDSIP